MLNSTSSPKLVLHVCMNIHDLIKSQSPTLFSTILSLQWLDLSVFGLTQKRRKIYRKSLSKYYSKEYSTAVLQKKIVKINGFYCVRATFAARN